MEFVQLVQRNAVATPLAQKSAEQTVHCSLRIFSLLSKIKVPQFLTHAKTKKHTEKFRTNLKLPHSMSCLRHWQARRCLQRSSLHSFIERRSTRYDLHISILQKAGGMVGVRGGGLPSADCLASFEPCCCRCLILQQLRLSCWLRKQERNCERL